MRALAIAAATFGSLIYAVVGHPSAANADPIMCGLGTYQNAYGVCVPTASTDWSAPVATDGPDAQFYRLLTDPDQDYPMVIWNFPLVKGQALWVCQRQNWVSPYEATKELEASGAYAWDAARSIGSAGTVIYCPQNGYAPLGKWPSPAGS